MKYFLDTHYLIWCICSSAKIPKKIRDFLADPNNEIVISSVSLWEIALKCSLKKLVLEGFSPEELPGICAKLNFKIESLSGEESSTYHLLKGNHHRDPFDRMLIWQAISKGYTLITADDDIKKYEREGLLLYK